MGETLEYANMFARFPFALRRFMRNTLTLDEARQIVSERMARRAENFLRLVESTIYGNPRSPYFALLKSAGCEITDLRALVTQMGLEGALCELRQAGVYIGFEEFKGRKPITRNGLELKVTPRDLDNPLAHRDFNLRTGGSTGAASSIGVDLTHIAARSPDEILALSAQGLLNVPTIMWYGILPDFTPSKLLAHAYIQQMPHEWFSHIGWRDSKGWLRYDAAMQYMLFWMQRAGIPIKAPRIVRINEARVIAEAVGARVKIHGKCLLSTQISRAVRVALAAHESGLDLAGATFRGGGEPATPAKVRAIEQTGARYLSGYATVDTGGALAAGCANGADGSDVHLLMDAFALVTHPHHVPEFGVTVPAFHITTLLSTAPKVMLNVQLDDYGIVEERRCGCELDAFGYTTHLRQIRSYSKLTGEGVTLIDNELIHILENVLPAEFGGTPQDYQLMEQEDAQGLTRLALLISPRVEIQNEGLVIQRVLQSLRAASSSAAVVQGTWQRAGTLEIKRIEPIWTGRGKLNPLHLSRATQEHLNQGEQAK